jgi:hypothetical protein
MKITRKQLLDHLKLEVESGRLSKEAALKVWEKAR